MKEAVPTLPLLNAAQLAQRLEVFASGKSGPEGLSRDLETVYILRNIEKIAFAVWHRWFMDARINVSTDDLKTAFSHIADKYSTVPRFVATMTDMQDRGYGQVVDNVTWVKGELLASGLHFFRAFDAGWIKMTETEKTCVELTRHNLRNQTGLENADGLLMIGAFEAADQFLVNLWRVIRAVDADRQRALTPHDYHVAAGQVAQWLMGNAYRWRQDAMGDVLYQETGPRKFDVQYDDAGHLDKVTFHPLDREGAAVFDDHPGLKASYKESAKAEIHTGCPVVHAKTPGLNANNPVRLTMDMCIRAGHSALFRKHPSLTA